MRRRFHEVTVLPPGAPGLGLRGPGVGGRPRPVRLGLVGARRAPVAAAPASSPGARSSRRRASGSPRSRGAPCRPPPRRAGPSSPGCPGARSACPRSSIRATPTCRRATPTSGISRRRPAAASRAWWFGGGWDLTPYYGFEEDAAHWHRTARDAVAPFGPGLHARFKAGLRRLLPPSPPRRAEGDRGPLLRRL